MGTINAEGARTRSGGFSTRSSLSLGTPTTPINSAKKKKLPCEKMKEATKDELERTIRRCLRVDPYIPDLCTLACDLGICNNLKEKSDF